MSCIRKKRLKINPEDYLHKDPDNCFRVGFVSDEIGYGLFTTKDFEAGQFLLFYRGERLSKREYDDLTDLSYAFTNRKDLCVNAEQDKTCLARFINDSEDNPNCYAKIYRDQNRNPHVMFVTLCSVSSQSELRYDYGLGGHIHRPWKTKKISNVPEHHSINHTSGSSSDFMNACFNQNNSELLVSDNLSTEASRSIKAVIAKYNTEIKELAVNLLETVRVEGKLRQEIRSEIADKEQSGGPGVLECSITTEASTTGRSKFRKKVANNKEQPGLPDDLDCSITTEASTTGTSLPQIENGIDAGEDKNDGQTRQLRKSKYRKKVADNKEQPVLPDDLDCSITTEASTTGTSLTQIDNGIDAREDRNEGQMCQHEKSKHRQKIADNEEQPGLPDDLDCSITTEASTTGTSLPQIDNGIDAREDRNEGQMCQHEKSKHRQKIADNEEQPGLPDDLDYSITTVASTTGTSLPQIDNGIDAREDRN